MRAWIDLVVESDVGMLDHPAHACALHAARLALPPTLPDKHESSHSHDGRHNILSQTVRVKAKEKQAQLLLCKLAMLSDVIIHT
jgi:hypothetical protein